MTDTPRELAGIAHDLHHVAIVVRSIAEARSAWEALGLASAEPEYIEDQDVNVLVCTIAGQRVELVERWASDWDLNDSQQKELWGVVFDSHASDGRAAVERSARATAQFACTGTATRPTHGRAQHFPACGGGVL